MRLHQSAMTEAELQAKHKRLTSRIESSSSRPEISPIKLFLDVAHEMLEEFSIDGSSDLQLHLSNVFEVLEFIRDRLPLTKKSIYEGVLNFSNVLICHTYECSQY